MNFTLYTDKTAFRNGIVVPSGGVLYTGATLEFLSNSTIPFTFPCDGNLNQVLNLMDQAINNLLVQNNLTELEPDGLSFNPATVQVNQLHQVEINAISANIASIASIQEQIASLTGNTLPVVINMQCLTSSSAPCETAPSTYPLIAVLNSILTELCAIKSYLGI